MGSPNTDVAAGATPPLLSRKRFENSDLALAADISQPLSSMRLDPLTLFELTAMSSPLRARLRIKAGTGVPG